MTVTIETVRIIPDIKDFSGLFDEVVILAIITWRTEKFGGLIYLICSFVDERKLFLFLLTPCESFLLFQEYVFA